MVRTVEVMLADGTWLEFELFDVPADAEIGAAALLSLTLDGVPLPIVAMKTPDGVVTVRAEPSTPAVASERFDELHRRLGVNPEAVSPLRRMRHATTCGNLRAARPRVTPRRPRTREGSGRRLRPEAKSRSGDSGDRPPRPSDVEPRPGGRAARRVRGGSR
jgi:hypothetical protein